MGKHAQTGGTTFTGNIAMSGGATVTGLPAADANGEAVRYEQLTALGTYSDWTPSLTASTTNPTNWAGSGRYTQLGKHVSGWGKVTAQSGFTTGTGTWRLSLPVAPKQSTLYPRIGEGMVYNNNMWFAYVQLELPSSADYVQAMVTGLGYEDDAGKLLSYTSPNKYGWQKFKVVDTTFMTSNLSGNDCQVGATITWKFDYEAA